MSLEQGGGWARRCTNPPGAVYLEHEVQGTPNDGRDVVRLHQSVKAMHHPPGAHDQLT